MRYSIVIAMIMMVVTEVYVGAQPAMVSYRADPYEFDNVVGLNFSTTTGSGLFYERRITSSFRLKAVGYYYLSENSGNSNSVVNAALEGQFDLFRTRIENYGIRSYLCLSGRYYDEENSALRLWDYRGGFGTDTVVAQSNFINSYNLGIGLELIVAKRVSLGVVLGYGLREERLFPDWGSSSQYPVREVLPTIGIDLGVHF